VVDGRTWQELRQAGADPLHALARHDAYAALDAADALLRTGPTGTNVADVVVGLAIGS
jgi:hydroxypyruvate reductase